MAPVMCNAVVHCKHQIESKFISLLFRMVRYYLISGIFRLDALSNKYCLMYYAINELATIVLTSIGKCWRWSITFFHSLNELIQFPCYPFTLLFCLTLLHHCSLMVSCRPFLFSCDDKNTTKSTTKNTNAQVHRLFHQQRHWQEHQAPCTWTSTCFQVTPCTLSSPIRPLRSSRSAGRTFYYAVI